MKNLTSKTIGMRLSNFLFIILIITSSCTQEKNLRVAAIQLHVKVGEFDANLENAEKHIRKAFEGGADLVLIPEFFTSPGFGFPFNQDIVDAIEPFEGKSLNMLISLSKEYNGIIGGSFLAFHGEAVHNSFVLVFPDGKYFVHNKDYPTYNENCFYTGGHDDGVFETEIGTIGVALCWEYIRTETVKRMLDKVDLVIGGSCWPEDKNPETNTDDYLLKLLQNAPTDFASITGVPVVHANHVGKQTKNYTWKEEQFNTTMYYLGETMIVDGNGQILQSLSYEDGEGVILSNIVLGKVKESPAAIPDRFWIPEFNEAQHNSWNNAMTGPYLDFYKEFTLPYVVNKLKDEPKTKSELMEEVKN